MAPIVNGTTDSGDGAVVALTNGSASFCTGTLIAPRVVVTAAHCLDPSISPVPITSIVVFLGTDVFGNGELHQVIDGKIHPDWSSSTLQNDIGLLLLDTPASVPPVPMNAKPFDLSFENETVRVVGFGKTGAGSSDEGLKREATTTVTGFTETTFRYDTSPGQTCFGDSGGPGFMTVEGTEVLVGVTSSGDPDCNQYGVDTRVDAYQQFILDYVMLVGACVLDGVCVEACGAADPDCSGPCPGCGDALLGDPCERNLDCASGLCIAAIDEPSIHYCSDSCDKNSDCAGASLGTEPMVCTPTDQATYQELGKVCVYPAPSPGAVGWECTGPEQCRDGLCIGGLCSKACVAAGGADCPLGFTCQDEPATSDAGPARHLCLPAGNASGGCAVGASGSGSPGSTLTLLLLGLAVCIFRRTAHGRTKAHRHPHRRR